MQVRWKAAGASIWAAIASVAVIWLSIYSLQTAGQAKATAKELRAVVCPFYRDIAALPVSAKSSELGRGIVKDAATAYLLLCVRDYGPLPPVDPEAYKPAPASSRVSGSRITNVMYSGKRWRY